MTDKAYNGWTNYETWAVSLWLDNEQGSYNYWREQAEEHCKAAPTCPQVLNGIWTTKETAKFNLADQLREEIRDGAPLGEADMYSDLLGAALDEVNWQEIAENWLIDLIEPAAEKQEKTEEGPPPVIASYSRAQAISDGVLINVTATAQQIGFRFPTALTAAVWKTHVDIPRDTAGRLDNDGLWDILLGLRNSAKEGATKDTLLFTAKLNNFWYPTEPVQLKAVCSPGDDGEPVITIMFPEED